MSIKSKIYEEYLVASARLGDRSAFEALVRYRGPRLFAHAWRLLGNRDEALDVVQEAWVEITRGLKGLRHDGAFPAWAYRIVSRLCARTIDRNVRDREIASQVPDPVVDDQGAQSADARSVRAAIALLPPDQAATIRLFYLEEFSVQEVATAMDVPVGTVKTRLMHARNALRKTLKGNENV